MMGAALLLAGCGAHSCPTTVITTSGGGGGGTVTTGGNVCGSGVGVGGGPSAARAYYLDGTVEAANLGTNGSFLTDTAITPPTEAGSGAVGAESISMVGKSSFWKTRSGFAVERRNRVRTAF